MNPPTNQVRILIEDRTYQRWSFQDVNTNIEIPIDLYPQLDPVQNKYFTKDIVDINTNAIVHSPTRVLSTIAGVLQLNTNKTYGRTTNKKRLFYKCIPDDRHLPAFLVPYEPKIGFSKVQPNKYVIFRFDQWIDKHPQGILVETLGDVDSIEAFYEYQLYSKSLHVSINEMTSKARNALKKTTTQEYVDQILKNPDFAIQDRTKDYVFTIDPKNSLDFDDGFSIRPDDNNSKGGGFIMSVYIANVYVWLETMDLWNSFSQRVATIYLPDYRRPMLPTVLSDALCSLQEKENRFAFIMDVPVSNDGVFDMEKIRFSNGLIRVAKNHRYEDVELLDDEHYLDFLKITAKMDKSVANSHDLVAYWMIFMNTYCAVFLAKNKCGIFRSVSFNESNFAPMDEELADPTLSKETRRVIRNWNNTTGQYVCFSDDIRIDHDVLQLKSYAHITSPIRRLVDLLNYMYFCRNIMDMTVSQNASQFMTQWIGKMEYVNTSMRSIRKIQTDCDVLYRCLNDPNILSGDSELHSGIVFDKMVKVDGSISYMVYLERWKMLSRINIINLHPGINTFIPGKDIGQRVFLYPNGEYKTRIDLKECEIPNYSRRQFKIYLFQNEDQTKKKIQLQLYIE
jgi:hypothetical protein